MVQRSYQQLAEHYGCIISPCLPRTPEHKGGVEGDVKYVKKNFLPCFREGQKEKNIKMPTISDLSEALAKWGEEVADTHIIHGVGRSPVDIFSTEEKKALRPLPTSRWELATWGRCTVRRDWRIMYESAYYSVPFNLIEKMVEVCVTNSLVRIFLFVQAFFLPPLFDPTSNRYKHHTWRYRAWMLDDNFPAFQ